MTFLSLQTVEFFDIFFGRRPLKSCQPKTRLFWLGKTEVVSGVKTAIFRDIGIHRQIRVVWTRLRNLNWRGTCFGVGRLMWFRGTFFQKILDIFLFKNLYLQVKMTPKSPSHKQIPKKKAVFTLSPFGRLAAPLADMLLRIQRFDFTHFKTPCKS